MLSRREWIKAVAVVSAWPVLAAAQTQTKDATVSLARAAEYKRTYPYVRSSLLASFDVPLVELAGLARSPYASSAGGQALVLPPEVTALDGKLISVRGYMLPLDLAGTRVTQFILTASIDSCHFGLVGQPNEWMLVTMAAGKHVPFPKARPITVFGRFSAKAEWQGRQLVSLYRITADAIAINE